MRQRVVTLATVLLRLVWYPYMDIGASLSSTKLATEMVFRAGHVWSG